MKRSLMILAAILIPIALIALVLHRYRRLLIPMIDETRYLWPVPGFTKVTSRFGNRKAPVDGASTGHNGIDIGGAGIAGADVVAPWDGSVHNVYRNDAGGNQVIIHHDDGRVTGYAHLAEVLVRAGDRVTRGQVIARVGSTGRVTGPHLHFTVRPARDAAHIDPETLYA